MRGRRHDGDHKGEEAQLGKRWYRIRTQDWEITEKRLHSFREKSLPLCKPKEIQLKLNKWKPHRPESSGNGGPGAIELWKQTCRQGMRQMEVK